MREAYKLLVAIVIMSVGLSATAEEKEIYLNGRVKDAIFGIDLTKSVVRIYDENGVLSTLVWLIGDLSSTRIANSTQ